jgi:hypothetical protein
MFLDKHSIAGFNNLLVNFCVPPLVTDVAAGARKSEGEVDLHSKVRKEDT